MTTLSARPQRSWVDSVERSRRKLHALKCLPWAEGAVRELVALTSRLPTHQESREPGTSSPVTMTGELQEGLLCDLLQLFAQNRDCGVLRVAAGSSRGGIYFKGGEVYHAEFEQLRAEQAFVQLLRLGDRGRFEFARGETSTERSITRSLNHLLMDSLRSLDEAAGAAGTAMHGGAGS